jgi:hypothetical protein
MQAAFLGNYPVFESPKNPPVRHERARTKPGAEFRLAMPDARITRRGTAISGSNESLNEKHMIKRLNDCLLIVLAG